MATLNSTTLRDIASAVADELQLDAADRLSVTEITVSVTYAVRREEEDFASDWLDRWYDEQAERFDIPFD